MMAYPSGTGTPWQTINVPSRDVLAARPLALLVERLPVLRLVVCEELIETNNIVTLRRERTTRSR
jgi:hypothetical protein